MKLSKLRRDKSAGPDEVKPNVVKELRNEIFLFEKLLAKVSPHQTGRKPMLSHFNKGDKVDPAN